MDHVKIALPKFQVPNKMSFGLGQLHVTLVSMKAHGHVNDRYAYYFNGLWLNDPSFTIGSLLQLFKFLKKNSNLSMKYLFGAHLQNMICFTRHKQFIISIGVPCVKF
jgi:hypothetical protein